MRPHLWLIRFIGVIVPLRFRARFRREWEAELEYRESLLARWDRLDWRNKLKLMWRSLGAFWDALWLQQLRWEDEMIQDLRFGVRMLRTHKGFTIVATLSLALGIGANTSLFSVANSLLLRPPAGVAQPDRLVVIGSSSDGHDDFIPPSYPNYLDIRRRATTLEDVYAYEYQAAPMSLAGPGGAERVFGHTVTANYFTVLGVRPVAGRLFISSDGEERRASPVVALSHSFWARRFLKDPAIVGQTMRLNGQPVTVVGVGPEGFRGSSLVATDLWIVAGLMPSEMVLTRRDLDWGWVGGRLKPGVSAPQAAAELDAIGRALEREYPEENRGMALRLEPASLIPGDRVLVITGFLALLMGIVSLVLAVACANVAGVLLARATARRREIAVRMALGAGRARLARQLLTETVMLFVLGGAAGLLLARALTSLLLALLPALPIPPVELSLPLDGRVIAFTMALSLVAALLTGLAPVLQTLKTDVISSLKNDSEGLSGRTRLRNAFVVGQVAVSIVVVVATGLFVRALQQSSAINPGFDPQGVELASLDLSLAGYTDTTGSTFARALVDRVRALPGVQEATLTTSLPLRNLRNLGGLSVSGVHPPSGQRLFYPDWNSVEPGYFATMRIPLVAGRDFSPADRKGAQPVAIVSEAAARRFWPGQDAIGKQIQLQAGGPGMPGEGRTSTLVVIGVAGDVKYRRLSDEPGPFVYAPLQQEYGPSVTIVARTIRAQRLAGEIRALVAEMDPNLPIIMAQTLAESTALSLAPLRVAASVAGILGLIGLLLAAIGIYGVTTYTVTRRTREIGIRIALGAQRGEIISMVLRQGLSLVAIGSGIGLILAAMAALLLARMFFGIPPFDPVTYSGAAALFAIIGLAACYMPARHATRIDPLVALRHE